MTPGGDGTGRDIPGAWLRTGLWIAAITLVLDQASKIAIVHVYELAAKGRIVVLPFMDLLFTKNTGISYGMLSMDDMAGQWALALFAAIVAVALAFWLARGIDTRIAAIGVGSIIGGAIGNAIDRIAIGGVADFVLLHWRGYQWYVFNIADVAIVVGVVALLYESMVESRSSQ